MTYDDWEDRRRPAMEAARRQEEQRQEFEWQEYLDSEQGREDQYLSWCRTHGLDPQDVDSMVAYEGPNVFKTDQ